MGGDSSLAASGIPAAAPSIGMHVAVLLKLALPSAALLLRGKVGRTRLTWMGAQALEPFSLAALTLTFFLQCVTGFLSPCAIPQSAPDTFVRHPATKTGRAIGPGYVYDHGRR